METRDNRAEMHKLLKFPDHKVYAKKSRKELACFHVENNLARTVIISEVVISGYLLAAPPRVAKQILRAENKTCGLRPRW